MSSITRWLDRTFYPQFEDRWDDKLFRGTVLRQLQPDAVVLDFGAGRGRVQEMNIREEAGRVVGADVDPIVAENPHVHEAVVLDPTSSRLPFEDRAFDLIISDNVFEHLEDPGSTLAELARILEPGGRLLIKTPNRRHYVPLLASLTPTWFHRAYNRMRSRPAADTFPTRYRCNTPEDLARLALPAGLEVCEIELIEGRPEYLRFLFPAYLLGIAYEKAVNSRPNLRRYRCVMIATLTRPRNDDGER